MNVSPNARLRTPRLAVVVMLTSLLGTTTVAAGCRGNDPPPVTPIPNNPDHKECEQLHDTEAGRVRCREMNTCEAACDGLRRAECAEGFTTPGGNTCEQVCKDSDRANRNWPKACWAEAKTRDDVRKCGKTRCLAREAPASP